MSMNSDRDEQFSDPIDDRDGPQHSDLIHGRSPVPAAADVGAGGHGAALGARGFLYRHGTALGMALVLLCGSGIRLKLIFQGVLGHLPDGALFVAWTQAIMRRGLGELLQGDAFCDYPPLGLLVMWFVGQAVSLVDPTLTNVNLLYGALKAPACLADVLIAVMLFVEGRRLFGPKRALAAAALYFLNPVSIYNSAYWGQVDAIHTALLLGALLLITRGRWGGTGFMMALAILYKFQSIALAPLIIFETYRYRGFRGMVVFLGGASMAVILVCLPFAKNDVLTDVVMRSYVNVVGHYNKLSPSAFNVWHLVGTPDFNDTGVPPVAALVVADGQLSIPAAALPLKWLSWRKLSLAAYALAVALVLSLYSYRHGALARTTAAGLLFLAFFLIPTEMHERYFHPAVAFLTLWAVSGPWRERVYVLLSAMMLLNLAHILPPEEVASLIATTFVAIFVVMLGWCVLARGAGRVADVASDVEPTIPEPAPPASHLVNWFRRLTLVTAGAVVVFCAVAGILAAKSWRQVASDSNVTYLGDLHPIAHHQEWRQFEMDRSVEGGLIWLGDTIYLRGAGAHAPSEVTFTIPANATEFRALVGINGITTGQGSAVATVELDGATAYESPILLGGGQPVEVRVPLGDARHITFRAHATDDGDRCDHVDWALARFVLASTDEADSTSSMVTVVPSPGTD